VANATYTLRSLDFDLDGKKSNKKTKNDLLRANGRRVAVRAKPRALRIPSSTYFRG